MDFKKYNEYKKKTYPEIKKINFMDTCDKCGTNLTLIEKIAMEEISTRSPDGTQRFLTKIIAFCNKCIQYYDMG